MVEREELGEPLELPCDACDGDGVVDTYHGERRCAKCGGGGFMPTPFGEKIVELIRHNFRPMLDDAQGQQ